MRIWIVTHLFSLTDGQGHVNYEIAQYLAEQGHQVCLVATDTATELMSHPNIQFFKVNMPDWLSISLLSNQLFAWRVRQVLCQHVKPLDIVHLNGSIAYYPADVNASHFVHTSWLKSDYHPFRLKSFSPLSWYQQLYSSVNAVWERRAYSVARYSVAVSDFVEQSLIKDCGISPDKVQVIWNGVDNDIFCPLKPGEPNLLRRELGLPDDSFIVIFTGDLRTNRKNLDLVLHALTELPAAIHLAVLGKVDGSPYPAMAGALGIGERVHFLGYRRDVAKFIKGADAFAFPSNYDPCPLVVLEALSSGLPLITSRSVGNSALLQHGENGFILDKSDDLSGIINCLRELAQNRRLAEQISAEGRRTAEAYSWKIMAQQYEMLYQKILREKESEKAHQSDLVSI